MYLDKIISLFALSKLKKSDPDAMLDALKDNT